MPRITQITAVSGEETDGVFALDDEGFVWFGGWFVAGAGYEFSWDRLPPLPNPEDDND